jgi:hypothetical protein
LGKADRLSLSERSNPGHLSFSTQLHVKIPSLSYGNKQRGTSNQFYKGLQVPVSSK